MYRKSNSFPELLMSCSEDRKDVQLKGFGQDNVKQSYFSRKKFA